MFSSFKRTVVRFHLHQSLLKVTLPSVDSWCRTNCSNFSKSKIHIELYVELSEQKLYLLDIDFRNGKLDIFSLYWNRYLRLTPLFSVCLLVAASTFRFFGHGPIWPISVDRYVGYCEQHWLSSLLYVQNYVNPKEFVRIKETMRLFEL